MTQLLLTAFASVLLGLYSLRVQNVTLTRQNELTATEASETATAIAQEMIEEISVRRFDQRWSAPGQFQYDSTKFTSADSLGRDAGEAADSVQNFSDVDDFKGYSVSKATPHIGSFAVSCNVYYVLEDAPDVQINHQSFLKRLDVKVKNPFVMSPDSSVTMSKVISYRFK